MRRKAAHSKTYAMPPQSKTGAVHDVGSSMSTETVAEPKATQANKWDV